MFWVKIYKNQKNTSVAAPRPITIFVRKILVKKNLTNILYKMLIYLNQLKFERWNIVLGITSKILESFDYFEYLNSISFHPPAMIITTIVFFYIRRKILLAGKKN